MTTLSEKRADWLYAHFQGVSRVSERLLFLFGTFLVSATAVWRSQTPKTELPLLKVDVGKELLFGWLVVLALFVLIAFFGNYDHGEETVRELAVELKADYSDLWFIDTFPTVIEFAQYRRPGAAATRSMLNRAVAAMLYPIIVLSALLWLIGITAHEAFLSLMSPFDVIPFLVAIPLALVALSRGWEYFARRWATWRAAENARSEALPA